jgi:ABC-type transporter Mla MlaB component
MTPPPFPAEITLQNAVAALGPARAHAVGGAADLSTLVRFDSAAVAVLVELRRAAGPALVFRSVPPNLLKLAALYGVDGLLFGPGA